MFYAKNLPPFERALRIVAGLGFILLGMLYFQGGLLGLLGLWGALSAASGVGSIVTGFFGFCPACAMVGRKLDRAMRRERPGHP